MNTQSQENEFQLNEFYRDQYRRTMKWLTSMIVVCAILSTILVWISYDRKQPAYYAAMTTGQVIPMHSLSEPVVSNDFILQWSALTARLIYNLSFASYQQELSQAQDRFTPEGWEKMMAALKGSGLIDSLVSSRLMITSVVSGPPVILAQMLIHGRYTWRVQMKMLVTYTSNDVQKQREMVVTMNIQRVPTLDAAQGIQIIDFTSGSGL